MDYPFAPDSRKFGRYAGTAFAVLLACTALIPSSLKAQQSLPQEVSTREVEPTFKLQVERNLVTVRVVVRNGKDEAVDNLRQEDFQLFDHGKKQTILHFSMEKPPLNAAEKSAPSPSPAEPGAVKGTPPAFILPRHFVALYFDDVNTRFSGLVRTRDAADHFLQASFHAGDRVGVFTASGQKPLDFTDDLAKVRQALAEIRPHPLIAPEEMCGAISPYEAYLIAELHDPSTITLAFDEMQNCGTLSSTNTPPTPAQFSDPLANPTAEIILAQAQRVLSAAATRSKVTLLGIESLVRLMSTLPGQRSLVIVSDGFPSQTLGESLSQISDHALRANVIINALDARGLYITSVVADASVAGQDLSQDPGFRSSKETLMREEAMRDSDSMGTLVQNTGGILYENNNDLEAGFRRVAAVPDTAYTLAFSPDNLKHDGSFHPLKVTLASQRGVTVQARKGYYAPKRAEDAAAQEKEDLQESVFSQNEMQALPIQVGTQFFMINKSDAEIDVLTHVDLQQLNFRKEGDRNLDNLTIVTALFDRDGHYVTGQQKSLELHLRNVNLEKFLRTGIKIETDFNVKAGTYLVRTVVRDSESGQISALNRTIEIPY